MLSNAYFLAKFRFDTAENEPAKNLQNFIKFAKFANFADTNQALPVCIATYAHEGTCECAECLKRPEEVPQRTLRYPIRFQETESGERNF